MKILLKDLFNCPYLILAPMQGVGDVAFRKAMVSIGGFDEAVSDFLRVPIKAHVKSLALKYNADETAPIPFAPQIMGSDPKLLADMAIELEKRGTPRIDFNCGCPSNTVTGRGAGSKLLLDPNLLHANAKAIVKAVRVPVTLKMRSGYEDISLFKENLIAAQESGISYLTLHPRTKADGYENLANWDLIAKAKELLKIPVVGNGDIFSVEDAIKMLKHTKCDALMIGRGSLINPFIFHQIRSHFANKIFKFSTEDLCKYVHAYVEQIPKSMAKKTKINKIKQLMSFLFKANPQLSLKRQVMLSNTDTNLDSFLRFSLALLMDQ